MDRLIYSPSVWRGLGASRSLGAWWSNLGTARDSEQHGSGGEGDLRRKRRESWYEISMACLDLRFNILGGGDPGHQWESV